MKKYPKRVFQSCRNIFKCNWRLVGSDLRDKQACLPGCEILPFSKPNRIAIGPAWCRGRIGELSFFCWRHVKEEIRSLYCSSLQLLYSLNILIGKILPGSFSNNIMHKRVKSPMWIFHYQELWEGTSIVIFSLKSFKFRFWLSKMAVVGENPTHESSNSGSSFNFGLGSEIPSPLALANCGKV